MAALYALVGIGGRRSAEMILRDLTERGSARIVLDRFAGISCEHSQLDGFRDIVPVNAGARHLLAIPNTGLPGCAPWFNT